MHIDFSPPDITNEEVLEVHKTLLSGWITTGKKTKQFERDIEKYLGVNKVACLNSQSACAEIILRILELNEDDEVIIPAYTYTASASVVYHVGAKIIFVDSQKDKPEINYDELEKLITEKTKVIIPVDIGGIPCDYDRIFEILEKKKHLFKPTNKIQRNIGRIIVCADSAHAFGAVYKGKKLGTVADFTSFSFHAVKNITTAEGGALTWKKIKDVSDDEIYNKIQLYSLHGQSKDALSKINSNSWEYDIIGPWYKCNMTDIAASIGIIQLKRYSEIKNNRKNIVERYNKIFKNSVINFLHHNTKNYESSYHLYITRVEGITEEQRNFIINELNKIGISVNVHYKPLPMFTAYKNIGFNIKDFPNAYSLYKNEITLPLHTRLSDDEVDYIAKNYIDIVHKLFEYEKNI